MPSNKPVEHYVTLFDSKFLPMGLALHESLMTHAKPFRLWVLCMDELVEHQLGRLSLPHVTLMPLRSIETAELLEVKQGRSRVEYCWTLTPFTFQAVFDRGENVARVTYLDADLFFFATPLTLLRELDCSGKHVLITEHAYAPEHSEWIASSGRFCVQFLTFTGSSDAATVMRWWQEKCVEWCFDLFEEDKFGDQKYLDKWPDLFAREVHIVGQTEKTLAPWNVKHFTQLYHGQLEPVFYHFHGFRIISPKKVRLLYENYEIGEEGARFYDAYLSAIRRGCAALKKIGIQIPYIQEKYDFKTKLIQILTRDPRFKSLKQAERTL